MSEPQSNPTESVTPPDYQKQPGLENNSTSGNSNSFSNKLIKFSLVGCGGLFVLIIGLSVLMVIVGASGILPDDSEETRAFSDAERKTETTSNAVSTPASVSQDEYFSTVGGQLNTVGESLSEIAELSRNPRMNTTAWNREMGQHIRIIQDEYASALDINPPARFRDEHSIYIDAMIILDGAMWDLTFGIDEQDVELIEAASEKMAEATEMFNEYFDQMNEYLPESS